MRTMPSEPDTDTHRFERRIKAAYRVLSGYSLKMPLHLYLRQMFRNHREMGARDRRETAKLIYFFFRLGKALEQLSVEERMAVGCFFCQHLADELDVFLIAKHSRLSSEEIARPLDEKLNIVAEHYPAFQLEDVFPLRAYLSDQLDKQEFTKSFFTKTDIFIRIRREFADRVGEELRKQGITGTSANGVPFALRISPDAGAPSLDRLNTYKRGNFEIQDLSSQLCGNYFKPVAGERWWDCCAGSGGKSLLLFDLCPEIDLFVSDVRPAIIHNLKLRFSKAGIISYKAGVVDLTNIAAKEFTSNYFDALIFDAPCSGSGTWARSPERIFQFNAKELEQYNKRQVTIAERALQYLKPGGKFIYITCSGFRKENEDVLASLGKQVDFTVQDYIAGYSHGADTMFCAKGMKK